MTNIMKLVCGAGVGAGMAYMLGRNRDDGEEPVVEQEARSNGSEWGPAIRALAGFGGGLLAVYGFRKGGLLGNAARATGAATVMRAATNTKLKKLASLAS